MPGGGNYPYMSSSQWNSAPFNQHEYPDEEFDVTISQTLSKDTTVWTNDYILEDDGEGYRSYDTSETRWTEVYRKTKLTPLDIINACKTLAQHLLQLGTTYIGPLHMDALIEECEGWVEDDYEVNYQAMTITEDEVRKDFQRFIRQEAMRANTTQDVIMGILNLPFDSKTLKP